MSEAQLRKVEAERDRLAAELETLRGAMSTKQACEEYVLAGVGDQNATRRG